MIVLTVSCDVTNLRTGEMWEVREEIYLLSNRGEVAARAEAKRNFGWRVAHALSRDFGLEGSRFEVSPFRIESRREQATWERHAGMHPGVTVTPKQSAAGIEVAIGEESSGDGRAQAGDAGGGPGGSGEAGPRDDGGRVVRFPPA